ncbi:Tachykinin-like peptides receptor 86C, partial [Trachymyrmex septentrionalis]
RSNKVPGLFLRLLKTILTNMNGLNLEHLYNCTASILERNVTLLLRLNLSEIRYFIEETLNKSTRREILRQALYDCVLINQERPFDLPWWQKLFWSLIFAVILFVATGGNIIVMWIVLGKKINCKYDIACREVSSCCELRVLMHINYFKVELSLSLSLSLSFSL